MIWSAWLHVSLAQAAIEVESPPAEGGETVILVTDEAGDPSSGETVRVIHRKGLAGERELAIGITDGRGRVRWRPEQQGLAVVRAGEQTLALRIVGPPPTATLVMLGLLVCAGVAALVVGGFGRPGKAARLPSGS